MDSTSPSDSAAAFLDQPVDPRPGEELDAARLEDYLRGRLSDLAGPLSVRQFPAGFSNLTYLLQAGGRDLVLRRPPFGANIKGGHDMAREFRILSALHPTYGKVPRPLVYCDDPEVLGAPFYVMERVRGVILRNRTPRGLTVPPETMRRLCLALADTLADLHRLDYAAAGLAGLGKPEGYVARQVAGWTQRYRDAQTDSLPGMETAAAWLAGHQPPEGAPALIHNDFRCDNLLLDPDDLTRPLALLDWEMATLGDPLMDLGTTLAYWVEPGEPAAMAEFSLTARPGFISRREFAERYAAATGRDLSNLLFYYVCGLFKLGVIIQQIYARYKRGLTRDARFADLIVLVGDCGRTATAAIERGHT